MSNHQPPPPPLRRKHQPPPPPPHPLKKQHQQPLQPPQPLLSPPPPPPLQLPVSPPLPAAGGDKTYRDCIPGICSLNCPQFCTLLPFPPPPPFFLTSAAAAGDGDDDSSKISPLMASLIAVLAAAFLLLFYYTVVSRYLRRRRRLRNSHRHLSNASSSEIRLDPLVHDPARPAGLDDAFIRQITVFKYRRGDGLVEGTECAVCLSEFSENESLRLMPNCEHAFHIPCIDTWLRSHSNCPLCRSGMDPVEPVRPDPDRVNVDRMSIHRSNDAVLVVREEEGEVVVWHDVELRDTGEIKTDPSP